MSHRSLIKAPMARTLAARIRHAQELLLAQPQCGHLEAQCAQPVQPQLLLRQQRLRPRVLHSDAPASVSAAGGTRAEPRGAAGGRRTAGKRQHALLPVGGLHGDGAGGGRGSGGGGRAQHELQLDLHKTRGVL